jgi:ABC-type transport system involved in multi-copper enzyme maturation permease subunit
MTWMAWRQFRTQALVALGALVVLALFMVPTGLHLRHIYDSTVAPCTNGTSHVNCSAAIQYLGGQDRQLQTWLNFLIVIVPALLGVFWGAPLVARELESGTYRLAWTQSVTRTRWLATKLGVVGLAAMAVSGLFTLGVTWWYGRFDQLAGDQFNVFDQRGIVAVAYAALAFAVGVLAGTLIRRTLPAMAATLAVFVAARLAFASWVRPNLLAARHLDTALDPNSTGFFSSNGSVMHLQANPPNLPNAWIYSTRIVDGSGHALPSAVVARTCPTLGVGLPPPTPISGEVRLRVPGEVQQTLVDCVTKLRAKYHTVVTYQPANRYWTLQGLEAAIFLAAALVLVGFSLWWVRRRLS